MTKRRAAASALLVFFASASVYSICLIGAGPVYAASRQALFPAESSLFTQANAGTLGSPLLAESRTVPNPNTWLPDFVDGNTLYVDSRLTTLSVANQSPIKFSAGLAAEVERLARRNDLRFFVVVTEKGADLVGERRTWASSLLRNQLWRRWTANPAFARDASRAVVLLMVRDNQDVGKFSVALRVGGELNNLGLNPQLFSSQTGPILPAMKSHLPSDPEQCLLSVLENVNELVASARPAAALEMQPVAPSQDTGSSDNTPQTNESNILMNILVLGLGFMVGFILL